MYTVVARKSGGRWYVAGINGENSEKQLSLDLSFLKGKTGEIISSGNESKGEPSFDQKKLVSATSGNLNITLKGNDGFVGVFA